MSKTIKETAVDVNCVADSPLKGGIASGRMVERRGDSLRLINQISLEMYFFAIVKVGAADGS